MKQHLFLRVFLVNFFVFISIFSFGQWGKKLGEPVNLPLTSERFVAISWDGKEMAFISNREGLPKIFVSKQKNDTAWETPQPVAAVNEKCSDITMLEGLCFNHDATKIYFSANFANDSSGYDIFFTEKVNEKWTEPKNIGLPVNSTNNNEYSPTISADDRTIYFSRDKLPITKFPNECRELWFSQRNMEGNWQNPVQIPVPVKIECEITPKICADNLTLIYAAARKDDDQRSFDIYYTKLVARNTWFEGKKIDTLNSNFDEFSPSVTARGNKIYYSVIRSEKKKTFGKIYTMQIPKEFRPHPCLMVSGKITDLFSKKPIPAKIKITDPYSSQIITELKNYAFNGKYQFFLPQGKSFKVDVYNENYSHSFFVYQTDTLTQYNEIQQDINLYPEVNLLLNVFDSEIFEPLKAKITIINDSSKVLFSGKIDNFAKGRYKITLPIGQKYKISFEKEHYKEVSMIFDLSKVVQFDEFERDVELTVLKKDFTFNVADETSNEQVEVEVVVKNLTRNEKFVTKAVKNDKGKYVVSLREGDKYGVAISPKGYTFYNTTIDLASSETTETNVEVRLTALKQDTKLTFNDVTFETNSADLNKSSFEELDKLVKLLLNNPQIKVEISAHTDDVGNDAYNLKLSEKRAQSVVNYLVEKNIPVLQTVAKGYGETKPVVPNTSVENRAKNRRVELKILEISQ